MQINGRCTTIACYFSNKFLIILIRSKYSTFLADIRAIPIYRVCTNDFRTNCFSTIYHAVIPIFKPTIRQLLRLCAQITPPGQSREEKKFLFHI